MASPSTNTCSALARRRKSNWFVIAFAVMFWTYDPMGLNKVPPETCVVDRWPAIVTYMGSWVKRFSWKCGTHNSNRFLHCFSNKTTNFGRFTNACPFWPIHGSLNARRWAERPLTLVRASFSRSRPGCGCSNAPRPPGYNTTHMLITSQISSHLRNKPI